MAERLTAAQQDLLQQIEGGGRLVEDETKAVWIEDPHGGRRKVRRPTLQALHDRGYLDPSQTEMPKIAVSFDANVQWWELYLGTFFNEEFEKGAKPKKKEILRKAAAQVVSALREAARTSRLYIPKIGE